MKRKLQLFSSNPSNHNLTKFDQYEFDFKSNDIDNDKLYYSYSFTPGSDWLKLSAIANGEDGELHLKFSGTPEQPTPATSITTV